MLSQSVSGVFLTNISASINIDHIQVFRYLDICFEIAMKILWFQRHAKALKTLPLLMRCQSCNWTAYRYQHSALWESGGSGAWPFLFQGIHYSLSGFHFWILPWTYPGLFCSVSFLLFMILWNSVLQYYSFSLWFSWHFWLQNISRTEGTNHLSTESRDTFTVYAKQLFQKFPLASRCLLHPTGTVFPKWLPELSAYVCKSHFLGRWWLFF